MSLSSKTELARALFRTPPSESVVRTSGTATADSADGTVTVQLEDGDVIEVGTIGSVSSGDTVTIHVQRGEAQVIASEGWGDAMQQAVDEATAIAEATNQHFWHDSNGAHVTEVTQDEWNDSTSANYHAGHNILINSLGILLRKAMNYIATWTGTAIAFYDGNGNASSNMTAQFGGNGLQLGKSAESHIEMDYHSLRMLDKEGNTYLHVSDLRDSSGSTELVETFKGDGTTREFNLTFEATGTDYTVSVSDSSGGTVTKWTTKIKFSTAPTNGATITVTYDSASMYLKAYTFGSRTSGTIGPLSFAEGFSVKADGNLSHAEGTLTTASGEVSHAEGNLTTASGKYSHSEGHASVASGQSSHAEGTGHATGWASHAEGGGTTASGMYSHAQNRGTIAQGEAQTTLGKYNVADSTSALIIGNGTSGSRSNALTVDWSGNVEAVGGLTLGGKAVSAWVVETGTNNGWAYEKRSDGTYRAKWSNDLTLNAGTAWGSGFYFHMQTAEIPVPSFSTSFEVVSAVKNNAQLAFYAGRVASTTALQGYWANNGSGAVSSSTFGKVTYTIEGTY